MRVGSGCTDLKFDEAHQAAHWLFAPGSGATDRCNR
jgi:hypothetical protein